MPTEPIAQTDKARTADIRTGTFLGMLELQKDMSNDFANFLNNTLTFSKVSPLATEPVEVNTVWFIFLLE
jgi:hypothetical protein